MANDKYVPLNDVFVTEKNLEKLQKAAARDARSVNHILNKAIEAYERKTR